MYAVMTAEPLESDDLLPPPSSAILRHYGTSEASMNQLAARPHQFLVMKRSTLDDVALVTKDARIEALRLAEAHDGLVIDLAIPRVIEQRSDDVSLAQATQWYAVDYAELEKKRIRTIGLAAFGLPEIVMQGVPETNHAMYSAVLAGLAHRLIAEWPANDPVGQATVTLRDIAYGLGGSEAAATPKDRTIDVDIAYRKTTNVLAVKVLGDPAKQLFGA